MDSKTILAGIIIALVVGAGAGYTLSPKPSSNLELGEYEKTLRSLENDKLELQNFLANAESENTELRNILNDAQTVFESLETKLNNFEAGFGSPDYDSGWNSIEAGEELTLPHGLTTTDDLFVYMIGRYFDGLTNQLYYGLCYWGQYEVGCGWTIDETNIYVIRGEVDVHWDEVRVYIWRINSGSSGVVDSSGVADVKYIEIVLNGEETWDYKEVIDLYGYKDVTITWLNNMEERVLTFWWNIKESDGSYLRVGGAFLVDYVDGPYYGEDEWSQFPHGSKSVKVGGRYLEIATFPSDDYEESDQVYIIIYATK
jgi:hypothetical protein